VACVVPAFADAVDRGLGDVPAASTTVAPAWGIDAMGPSIELPVYHHWRFSTGEAGDFESLCKRLKPDGDGAEMGLHAMDVTEPGLVRPAAKTVLVDMQGPLRTIDAKPRAWSEEHREGFQQDLGPLLDAGIGRATFQPPPRGKPYVPELHDPVIAPPAYGSWPAGVRELPAQGWVRGLNMHPVRRAAAGLGARVVRANQEAFVASAWEQAGDLRAAAAALGNGRLAAEVGRSWSRRAIALDDADLLQLTVRLHAILPGGTRSIRARLAASPVPAGLVSAQYLRQTRPGTPLARDWARRRRQPAARLAAEHVAVTLAASRGDDPDLDPARDFAVVGLPDGAQTRDPTLELDRVVVSHTNVDPSVIRSAEQTLQTFGLERPAAGRAARTRPVEPGGVSAEPSGGVVVVAGADVSAIAADVRDRLDPLGSVRASVTSRFPALLQTLAPGALPTAVPPVGPVFPGALSWDLLELGSEWLLPGAGSLRANRVRLLAVDPVIVAAILIGANHELARELLWRDYPVDLRATFFHRFWEYVDETRTDLPDLHPEWSKPAARKKALRELVDAKQETMTAVVVRGDLVRRYPSAHWFLQPAEIDGDGVRSPVEGACVEVSFLGALDAQTSVYGFDLTPDDVRGAGTRAKPGYYIGVEEAAGEARFGLNPAKASHFGDRAGDPRSWDGLAWSHLAPTQADLDALTHARATGTEIDGLTIRGTTWGRNAAHQARATWQRPFRMLMHAETLI
jgi:hypothetical protein